MATGDFRNNRRTLIRGALLATQDRTLGDLRGDILIGGREILAIGHNLQAPNAETIDAANMIVLPGFIDTHRHTWQTALRHIGVGWNFNDYVYKFFVRYGARYNPDDVYAANLLGAVSALESGITTIRDESNIQNSPQHTEAAIQALRDSGIRAVFDHGCPAIEPAQWMRNSTRPHPQDIRRIRRDVLASDDALVTLNMMVRGPDMTSLEVADADIRLMRELGLRGCVHVGCGEDNLANPAVKRLHACGLLGSDLTYVHCCTCTDEELRMIADSGGTISVSPTIDSVMPGLGLPVTGRALKAGIQPSLSSDVEVAAAGDMFTAMRSAFTAQQLENQYQPAAARETPQFSARDLLRFATFEGARACGLDHKIGSLTPGKQADLILLRADDLNLAPATDIAGAIVGGAHPGNVDSVMVAGRFVKRDGKLLQINTERVVELAANSRDRLLQESGP